MKQFFLLVFTVSTLFGTTQAFATGTGEIGSSDGTDRMTIDCSIIRTEKSGKQVVLKTQKIPLVVEETLHCGRSWNAKAWKMENVTIEIAPNELDFKLAIGTMKDPCIAEGPGIVAKAGTGIDFMQNENISDMNAAWRDTSASVMHQDVLSFGKIPVLTTKSLNDGILQLICQSVHP